MSIKLVPNVDGSIDILDTAGDTLLNFGVDQLADFVQGMPKVAGSPIVESGSNANGSYTKWADGTMICTGTLGSVHTTNTAGTSFYYVATGVITFPVAMVGDYTATLVPRVNAGVVGSGGAFSKLAASVRFWIIGDTIGSNTTDSDWSVVGRWKA